MDHLPKTLLPALILVAVIAFMIGCKHEPMVGPDIVDDTIDTWTDPGLWITPINTQPCSEGTVYFANTVYPLVFTYCARSGCHNQGTGNNSNVNLTTYGHIMNEVDPFDPGGSDLWDDAINETGDDAMPPSTHPQLTSAQEQWVFQWIQQGAPENSCNSCDTLSSSYGSYAAVATILQNKCNGCHRPPSPADGLDLSQYSVVRDLAQSERLFRALAHAPGYADMPPYPDGRFLPACDMYHIRKWIDNGALPN
jgi:hypothetical protein